MHREVRASMPGRSFKSITPVVGKRRCPVGHCLTVCHLQAPESIPFLEKVK